MVAAFEGFSPTWYDDGTGVMTIGYGHTSPLPAGVTEPLSVDAALGVLRADAAVAERAVTAAVKVRLAILPANLQKRYDALVSLAFNIGAGAFASSSLVRDINVHGAPRDWTPIGPLWLEWDHAGGRVLPGLLTRRQEEWALFDQLRYPT